MAYWHTLCAQGRDQFGDETMAHPLNESSNAVKAVKQKWMPVLNSCRNWAYEYYCFHDV
jgi:xylose isomerase